MGVGWGRLGGFVPPHTDQKSTIWNQIPQNSLFECSFAAFIKQKISEISLRIRLNANINVRSPKVDSFYFLTFFHYMTILQAFQQWGKCGFKSSLQPLKPRATPPPPLPYPSTFPHDISTSCCAEQCNIPIVWNRSIYYVLLDTFRYIWSVCRCYRRKLVVYNIKFTEAFYSNYALDV